MCWRCVWRRLPARWGRCFSSLLCVSVRPLPPPLPQNVNLADAERTQEYKQRKAKSKQPVYRGYDDEEEEVVLGGQALSSSRRLLAQYNEEEKQGPRLTLKGEEGEPAPVALRGMPALPSSPAVKAEVLGLVIPKKKAFRYAHA